MIGPGVVKPDSYESDTSTFSLFNEFFVVLCSVRLRGDFFKNRETRAQKYRDALRKNSKFCFLEHGGKGVNMFKFCSINLINTRLMLHLRQEMMYSTYFLALEVGQTFLRRLEQ